MSVGEGILWSTVLAIIFASIVLITKYSRWKTFGKVVAAIVGLGITLGGVTWLYFEYENRPQVTSSLNGISLGMSEVEVTLAKGAPDETSKLDPTTNGFRKYLLYKGYESFTYAVLRGPQNKMLVTDICDRGGYGRVLGFGEYSSEKDIVEKLGPPSHISVNENGTAKLLTYSQWNAVFEIAKGNVVKVCVTNRPDMRYSIEHPSIGNQ